MRTVLSLATLGFLVSCAPKAEVDELNARVEALEKRVESVESRPATATTAGPSAEDEAAAQKLYAEISDALAAGDVDTAKAKVDLTLKQYGKTKTAQRVIRVKQELDVFGKEVGNPEIEKWFVGSEADMDLQSGTTLVVFWEVWCPHCKREVPELQATYDKYNQKGLDVVGLTKITKSATEESVTAFIADNGVSYPVAKETGTASREFAVSGIPAAAVVKDGKVVWRGHPGRLSDEMIEGWLGS
ncbi:MAG: TlpA family protein disulfide reductase [Proteobacteria bacterium]|nr:TlpA family protein disulfide reductase [Pseudomonadota bacterium]MCP4920095.1 TlpA family protein disulfide reductase [Pseudomonadota bacterium]